MDLIKAIVELYKKTSTELPDDVVVALKKAKGNEKKKSIAFSVLDVILKNINLAKNNSRPICEDSGMPTFYVYYNKDYSADELKKIIFRATSIATKKNYLRENAVNSLTNKNTKTGFGNNIPIINFNECDDKFLKIDLMLKGGGSENVSMQYSLPDINLNADRDLDGIKKCIIDAVKKAQGFGCPPGIIGVGIGGDRASSYDLAKKQLFRKLNDKNNNKMLEKLENDLYKKLNLLGIGPMGLGGKTTVLGVKAAAIDRIPASFFVSVAYMCWACRRKSLVIKQ
jgi:fumarate hydratase class I